jgi:hypothetical protein
MFIAVVCLVCHRTTHGGTTDDLGGAGSIAAFHAVIRHRKVGRPKAGVPPEGPGSSSLRGELFSAGHCFKRLGIFIWASTLPPSHRCGRPETGQGGDRHDLNATAQKAEGSPRKKNSAAPKAKSPNRNSSSLSPATVAFRRRCEAKQIGISRCGYRGLSFRQSRIRLDRAGIGARLFGSKPHLIRKTCN